MCLLCFYRFSELPEAVLGDFLLNGRRDGMSRDTQQVRFFKLYFDFDVFSAENRRLFSIEFQLHTNSHITLWLPVVKSNHNRAFVSV